MVFLSSAGKTSIEVVLLSQKKNLVQKNTRRSVRSVILLSSPAILIKPEADTRDRRVWQLVYPRVVAE